MTGALSALPADARLTELRPEVLVFETRTCLLPATVVGFSLVLEGRPLALTAPVEALLVVDRDRVGYLFHCRLSLTSLAAPDRHLVELFIGKGRGSPGLLPPDAPK